MKIGILGSGDVAKTLASGFVNHGHVVTMGTREPNKLADWHKTHANAKVTSFREAAEVSEVVVLAVKGTVASEVLGMVGVAALKGKVVIDPTNPISNEPPVNGVLNYFTGPNDSLMERLQKQVPDARFVKAFNSVGAGLMVNPKLPSRPSMFICGDDAAAKKTVATLCDELGWEVEDVGHVQGARAIEPLCQLWCAPGFLRNDWAHAFKMLRPS